MSTTADDPALSPDTVAPEKILIGVSTCLLGREVRWDGSHRRDRFLTDTLSEYVEYLPVCPEMEAGFGVPREPFRLVGDPERPRMVVIRSGEDVTERMESWARERVAQLATAGLNGFIFKSKSPSSGMERVKVYDQNGIPNRRGVGLFARIFMEELPLVPTEEEGRLNDPLLRENFIERIFVMKRWREEVEARPSRGALVDFHTRHKLLLLSHDPEAYRELGRLVAHAKDRPLEQVLADYIATLMPALKKVAKRGRHVNVLQHAMGYFRDELSTDEKRELLETFDEYRAGNLPLIVPVTLVNHYVRKYDEPYLARQHYLHPHPTELGLRNHA